MHGRVLISIFILLAVLVSMMGCQEYIDGGNEVIINTVCPVMGDRVSKDTPYTTKYKGYTIGFCCPDCIDTFEANPEKYIKNIWGTEEKHEDLLE